MRGYQNAFDEVLSLTLGNPSKNFTAKISSREPRKPISLHYGPEKVLPDLRVTT